MAYTLTRIAPTPSGYLHLGNAYSFLLTAALAQRTGAAIFLRIDDLDHERVRPEYIDDIFRVLNFLGIQWQSGPRNTAEFRAGYSQLLRQPLYDRTLTALKAANLVFACSCSRASAAGCQCRGRKLPLDATGVSWRFDTGGVAKVALRISSSATVSFPFPDEMKNFVVRRKDGHASYQVASATDDLHFGIDLVVRGEDLLASSLAQTLLMERLGEERFARVSFVHHRLLTDIDHRKLSKSAGDTSIAHFIRSGWSAENVVALISKLAGASASTITAESLLNHAGLRA